MKKIITMLLLSLLVSSVFAVDLVKYKTYETESIGIIDVYFNYDATEPFDIKNESIEYFLFLKNSYESAEVYLENIENWWPWLCNEAIEHNCYNMFYNIFMEYGCCYADIYINKDGTVTVYTYGVPKNPESEE